MITNPTRSVLIVEDERIIAADLQQSLIGMGYDAFAIACSGDEAIKRATERCPDIILLDIRIKGPRDGIETAVLLRERFDVPLIYLTAHADDTTIARAKATEPYGYLLKPVKPAELRSVIEVAMHRHDVERRLRQRERWFATTLRSMADAVITVDLAGNITFMNSAAERLTETAAAQALGRPARDLLSLFDPGGSSPVESPLDRALRDNRTASLDTTMITRSNVRRLIHDSTSPVGDDRGRLGAVMVFRDLTDQQHMQRQLEIADRLASLGTMAAGVAHEINNPLAVVIANSDYIRSELDEISTALDAAAPELAERVRDLAQIQSEISRAGTRIGKIVGDLRTFSRPGEQTSGQADLASAIHWAIRTTSHEFRHRARLVHDLPALPPVVGDETRLGQVFVNLLQNAAQAIPPGKVNENQVTIQARVERPHIIIEVRDTGPGILPGNLQRIFEPFFTTKEVGEGTGLGLSVCHGIVTSMGGDIEVESAIGKGALFRVTLRIASWATVPPTRPLTTPIAVRPGRILVVDHDEMVHRTMSRLLRDHDLVCTGSGHGALALLAGERFDLILCDLMMPVMTGVELYEHLRAQDPELARRVVFMTGSALVPGKVEDFLRSVPNLRLEKPFGMPELQSVIVQVLGNAG
ncbi:MAG: response regulator [Deltaproteobacteria bacterium]|nr:MAG: response regulator [Deltaproteobacteria bacterium]